MPHYDKDGVTVHHGDCLDVLRELPDASVDAVCTDPPYGLEFMGKDWDSFKPAGARIRQRESDGWPGATSWKASRPDAYVAGAPFQQWCEAWATECLRVLKPGGHLLAFGGTRTWHRLACAIEDAGFEVRDSIAWMYGSGFPKSLDVSKAIDRAAGAEREVTRNGTRHATAEFDSVDSSWRERRDAPATDDARTWQGWGTAMKPAHEPVVCARKPLTGTVAANVLTHGTGALNIDATRIGSDGGTSRGANGSNAGKARNTLHGGNFGIEKLDAGRWPANVVLDEDQAAALDTMSGELTSGGPSKRDYEYSGPRGNEIYAPMNQVTVKGHSGEGGASRFFYTAKADAAERVRLEGVAHPTVKPLSLMRWLVRLVTPPGGVVLEPFAGSGTTVEACILEGFRCVAIEREADYLPLILQRIHRRRDPVQAVRATGDDGGLFDLLDEEATA